MDVLPLGLWLDLLGTFVFGISGATLAVRRRLDAFGVTALAVAAALSGGMLRDLAFGATPSRRRCGGCCPSSSKTSGASMVGSRR